MKLASSNNATAKRSPEIQDARNTVRRKGHTHKTAAQALGVSRVHLNYVLNQRRVSARLLKAINEMPENTNPA